MPTTVVADTHALLWYLTAPDELSVSARDALVDVAAQDGITVAAVSLIELVYVAEKRAASLDARTLDGILRIAEDASSPVLVRSLSTSVIRAMIAIPRTTVRDPFDRAIVATAQVVGCPLGTRDALLTRSFPQLCRW